MESRKLQRSKPIARLIPLGLFFVALFFVLGVPRLAQVSRANPEPKSVTKRDIEEVKKAMVQEVYGKLPLSFIQNDGQVDKKVKFYEKGSGHATFFTKDGVYLTLNRKVEGNNKADRSLIQSSSKLFQEGKLQNTDPNGGVIQSESVKLRFMGANKNPEIISLDRQEGKVNYFIGNDPKKWKTNIPIYEAVVYKEIYPGIDLKFYGNNRQMEYDIIVKPGADPSKVKFAYEGIKGLRVTEEGNLEIGLKSGSIVQKKPVVYQKFDGKRVNVAGRFRIQPSENRYSKRFSYGFELASYDKARPLLIDPILVYSTYLGGSFQDEGYGIAVDSFGNAYVTGATQSSNFPVTQDAIQASYGGGVFFVNGDAFVAKLNASGSALVYATYLGGSGGDGVHGSIAVDAAGNAYVTGITQSSNFPVTPGAAQTSLGGNGDAFVAKLNATGSELIYSTYLGGSGLDGSSGIAVDGSGNAYVTGTNHFGNFPVTSGAAQPSYGGGESDAFVAKLNSSGSAVVYATYLGGSDTDNGFGIAVDHSGNAYLVGLTQSTNFPVTPGATQESFGGGEQDAFVAKLNASGNAVVYATYLGGSDIDQGYGIAVDGSGNAYMVGGTVSSNFPVTPGAFQTSGSLGDAFVAKLNATGSELIYSTYLGGSGADRGNGIAVDGLGNAYVTGTTQSSNFPVTQDAIQADFGGVSDVFVVKLNAPGSELIYSTYLGGSNSDGGQSIAVDELGNAYVTGYNFGNFPVTSGAFQTSGSLGDAFVAKISAEIITTTTTTTISTPTTTTTNTTTTTTIRPTTTTTTTPSTTTTTTTSTTTTTTTTTTTSTTTTTTCHDQNKDKGKGHNKGKCKDHDKG